MTGAVPFLMLLRSQRMFPVQDDQAVQTSATIPDQQKEDSVAISVEAVRYIWHSRRIETLDPDRDYGLGLGLG